MLSTKNYNNNSSVFSNIGTFDNLIINDSITDYTGLYDTSNNIFIKYVNYDYLSNNYYDQIIVDQNIGNVYTYINNNYYQQSQIDSTFYTQNFINNNYYNKATINSLYFNKQYMSLFYYTKSQSDSNYYNTYYVDSISGNLNNYKNFQILNMHIEYYN